MKVASVGSIVLAAFLASAPGLANEAPATLPAEGGSAENGATKAAVCGACQRPQRQQRQSRMAEPLRASRRTTSRHSSTCFKEQVRNNPVMQADPSRLWPRKTSRISPRTFAAQTPQGGEADPSYWKGGRAPVQAR